MANLLSDFERQRLANIAERDALLKKLRLEAQSSGLLAGAKPGRIASASRAKKSQTPAAATASTAAPAAGAASASARKRQAAKTADAVPVRKSSRLRGIAADSEAAKRKAEEEEDEELARQKERAAKRIRRSDTFALRELVVSRQNGVTDGDTDGGGGGDDSLAGVDVVVVARGQLGLSFGTPRAERSVESKEVDAERQELGQLKLWESWEPARIKLTPERVYSMAFHPSGLKPVILAGDKAGHLGILDASQERADRKGNADNDDDDGGDDPDPIMTTLKPHTRSISSILVHPANPARVYTASYDSSVRELDLEKKTSAEAYAPADVSDDEPISGIDMAAADPNTLFWTTLHGAFGRRDLRVASSADLWQLSEKKIGGFSLFGPQPHYFATASLDRFVRVWDLRRLSHAHPVAVAEHESRLSVSHAAFNAAGQVVTASYDDTLKIYDLGVGGVLSSTPSTPTPSAPLVMEPDTVVRHNCQTGRWVTILRPHWQRTPTSPLQRFCIGNMNRCVDIFSSAGDHLAQLTGDPAVRPITAVPAVAVFHPSENWVAGGTASGKICFWR